MLSKIFSWFARRAGRLQAHEFGVVRVGPQELPMVPFKHPHMGKVKLFYVDPKVRDKLSEVQE